MKKSKLISLAFLLFLVRPLTFEQDLILVNFIYIERDNKYIEKKINNVKYGKKYTIVFLLFI